MSTTTIGTGEKRFAFGKNWEDFLNTHLTPETIATAEKSLKDFLGVEHLKGKTFLDVGCGSGIHSLAAIRLGATRIVSIDVDKDSVACCKRLAHEKEGVSWEVKEGSMLDAEFMRSLGTFDVVYCWGVAHHTGDMWRALEYLNFTVKEGSLLFVALYNTVPGRRGSSMWEKVKKTYVNASRPVQILMEWGYIGFHMFRMLIRLKNPFVVFKRFPTKRGMSYKHDLIDWLGGYPYEHARVEEVFHFYRDQHMELINLKTDNYIGNNQFLFLRR